MDMYIRMYDEMKRGEGDSPTIGSSFALIQTGTSLGIPYVHGSKLLFASSISCICRQKRNCGRKLKHRKQCFIFRRRKKASKIRISNKFWKMSWAQNAQLILDSRWPIEIERLLDYNRATAFAKQ